MTSNSGLVEAPASSEAVESAGLPGVRLVRCRLRWVALAAVLGLAVGGLLSLVRAPSYESTVFLSVTSSTVADAGSVARSAQAIARIATSPGVVGEPLRDAGLVDQAAAPHRYVSGVRAARDAPRRLSVTDVRRVRRHRGSVALAMTGSGSVVPEVGGSVGIGSSTRSRDCSGGCAGSPERGRDTATPAAGHIEKYSNGALVLVSDGRAPATTHSWPRSTPGVSTPSWSDTRPGTPFVPSLRPGP